MSRSYKKHPWVCDRNPFMKNYANRRIRRQHIDLDGADETGDHAWYKRVTCPWDICDWKSRYPESFEQYAQEQEDAMRRWGFKMAESRKELLQEWHRAISK